VCGSGAVVVAWVSPDSLGTACPPSGRNSTYRPVQILEAGSILNAAFPQAALRRSPAYTSVRGILQRLDPAELERAFRRHAEGLDQSCAAAPSRFIAIDGKTLRQSFDAFADRKAAHVLSAFAVDHQIILAHEVVDEKSNEIPAVQALIATLGLSGRVFTLDAMHCQKNLRERPRHRQ